MRATSGTADIHRNTFINAPAVLSGLHEGDNRIIFAGQITGVEGYVESTAMGLLAGIDALCFTRNVEFVPPPPTTCTGALYRYIGTERKDFQPMMQLGPPRRIRQAKERQGCGRRSRGHRRMARRHREGSGIEATGRVGPLSARVARCRFFPLEVPFRKVADMPPAVRAVRLPGILPASRCAGDGEQRRCNEQRGCDSTLYPSHSLHNLFHASRQIIVTIN